MSKKIKKPSSSSEKWRRANKNMSNLAARRKLLAKQQALKDKLLKEREQELTEVTKDATSKR